MHKKIKIIIAVCLVLIALASFYSYLSPKITGFATVEKQFDYTDYLNLELNESSEYILTPENVGLLKSIKLSGSYKTEGNVKVYLEDEDVMYLIFESSELAEESVASITGLVISNESKKDKDNKTKEKPKKNETIEINESEVINETPIINETNITIINETIEINKTININLEYEDRTGHE